MIADCKCPLPLTVLGVRYRTLRRALSSPCLLNPELGRAPLIPPRSGVQSGRNEEAPSRSGGTLLGFEPDGLIFTLSLPLTNRSAFGRFAAHRFPTPGVLYHRLVRPLLPQIMVTHCREESAGLDSRGRTLPLHGGVIVCRVRTAPGFRFF